MTTQTFESSDKNFLLPFFTTIITGRGKKIDFSNLDSAEIDYEDIVINLSRIPRFTGSSTCPVASHVTWCSYQSDDPIIQYIALHHDDTEAYLIDISKPLKTFIGGRIRLLEENLWKRVVDCNPILTYCLKTYNSNRKVNYYELPDEVKEIDKLALRYEQNNFVSSEYRDRCLVEGYDISYDESRIRKGGGIVCQLDSSLVRSLLKERETQLASVLIERMLEK